MATNIECFDLLTGRLFADLYDAFPLNREVLKDEYVSYLLGKDDEHPIESLFEGQSDAREFFFATVQWLIDTGYVSVKASYLSEGWQLVLTAKGLEALKSVPGVLGGPTLGDEIIAAARSGTIDQLKNLAGQAIGAGLKLGVGLFSS